MPPKRLTQTLNKSKRFANDTTIENFLSQNSTNLDDQVNDCVRYILFKMGDNNYFTKSELVKNIMATKGKQFEEMIVQVNSILKNTYGFNLLVNDKAIGSGKGYFISNALPYIDYPTTDNINEINDKRKILLILVLSHIFMTGYPVSDVSIYSFLKPLKILPDKRHELFGDVQDYITNILVKQKYLSTEVDTITKNVSYLWGMRAEKEISKHEILRFVCKMYKDRSPKTWTKQYQTANEQSFDNHRMIAPEPMKTED